MQDAVAAALALLDWSRQGEWPSRARVGWSVNEWLKKAVLLSFRIAENEVLDGGFTHYYDKVSLKYAQSDAQQLRRGRCACRATGRGASWRLHRPGRGADALLRQHRRLGGLGTMVDTWATVGSCAQIGRNVHLSGGVGIGGVLEPLQASPTIIEDDCFIGARSEIVEGVVVERGSVISMGVFIGQSTRIYDRRRADPAGPGAGGLGGRLRLACPRRMAATASTAP